MSKREGANAAAELPPGAGAGTWGAGAGEWMTGEGAGEPSWPCL